MSSSWFEFPDWDPVWDPSNDDFWDFKNYAFWIYAGIVVAGLGTMGLLVSLFVFRGKEDPLF